MIPLVFYTINRATPDAEVYVEKQGGRFAFILAGKTRQAIERAQQHFMKEAPNLHWQFHPIVTAMGADHAFAYECTGICQIRMV